MLLLKSRPEILFHKGVDPPKDLVKNDDWTNGSEQNFLLTPIQTFYENTNIFVTGGTGFLGVLLIEKLLISCPGISKIYMLLRTKKGKAVQSRLDELLEDDVNIVFHCAATVRFNETLRKACFINVRGVREVVKLAHQMPNLKSFIHVSTAYSNCIHNFIKEEIYPPPIDYNKLLNVVEALPDDALEIITH
ncbi:hypothetical protein NQ315_008324, partial [Exocentrus adspersus]